MAALTGAALAAIQIVPSIEATRLSIRGSYEAPRNLVELVACKFEPKDLEADWPPKWNSAILGRRTEAHQRQIYNFSVPPWRAIELVWPNISGRIFPTHRRWPEALEIERRVWTPSFYMGLLPFLFAASAWKLRKGGPADVRFLSWAVLLSAVASLGLYGWGWLAREFAERFVGPGGPDYSDEVGGLYWLMNILLPGYVYFRYPAKLLVITTLGIAMLAGKGWDTFIREPIARPPCAVIGVLVASLIGLFGAIVFKAQLFSLFEYAVDEPLFGPFDTDGAWRDLAFSLGHSATVCAVAWCLLLIARRRPAHQWLAWTALTLTIVELAAAQSQLVALAPSDRWNVPPGILQHLPQDREQFRILREFEHLPSSWAVESSRVRPTESLTWDRETLYPKYPLKYGLSLADVSSTLHAEDYRTLIEIARSTNGDRAARTATLDLLGVRDPMAGRPQADGMPIADLAEDATLYGRTSALPRAWIVHDIAQLSELQSRKPSAIRMRTHAIRYRDDTPVAWRDTAVVESNAKLSEVTQPPQVALAEHCRLASADPSCVELDVRLAAPGLVVLSDLYYPGWRAEVETDGQTRDVPIVRTNRVMRGVFLDAGEHHVVFRYRLASVIWGAAISAVAIITLLVAAVVRFRRARRSTARLPA